MSNLPLLSSRQMASFVSRGFHGRRAPVDPARVPPGQYVTHDFPVLSAGPTPHTAPAHWLILRGWRSARVARQGSGEFAPGNAPR